MTTPDVEDRTEKAGGDTAEEPVDEAADAKRLHPAQTGIFGYLLLTATDRTELRMERAHQLEAELYRVELSIEEATNDAERELLGNRADQLLRRLRVHLSVLSAVLPDAER